MTRAHDGAAGILTCCSLPIPLALSIGLIFAVPRFESNVALFAYVLATLIVLRTSFIGLAAAIALIPYKLDRNEIRAELARRT